MIVCLLHFISTPRGVGNGCSQLWGLVSFTKSTFLHFSCPSSPSLSLSLSGRQPTDPSERQEAARSAISVWIRILLPWTIYDLWKGTPAAKPRMNSEQTIWVSSLFSGESEFCLLKTPKEEEKNFFPDISTCYVCLTAIRSHAHMFQVYYTLKYLLNKTLILSLTCDPPSVHPSIHSVHISHHCFPKSRNELDGIMPSPFHGAQDTVGI